MAIAQTGQGGTHATTFALTLTSSHTTGAGANQTLIIFIATTALSVSGVTANGVDAFATGTSDTDAGTGLTMFAFTCPGVPASSTFNVVATFPTTPSIAVMGTSSYSGASANNTLTFQKDIDNTATHRTFDIDPGATVSASGTWAVGLLFNNWDLATAYRKDKNTSGASSRFTYTPGTGSGGYDLIDSGGSYASGEANLGVGQSAVDAQYLGAMVLLPPYVAPVFVPGANRLLLGIG